jgi:hypothetical protein
MLRWWLAILAISCGHPSAPAKPQAGSNAPPADAAVEAPNALENDLPRLAERAVKMFSDMQAALAAAGEDCAAATAKLTAIADANADVMEANTKVLRAGREKMKAMREEVAKHQAELDASGAAIAASPAMAKCSSDPAFAKVIDRLGGE